MDPAYAKPLPVPDLDTVPFWRACREHRVTAQACARCGEYRWPPRGVCPRCHSWDAEWRDLPGTGVIVSYTVPHRAFHPGFADGVPYVVADVALDATGGRVVLTAGLADVEWTRVTIGMAVMVEFDDVTDEVTIPKFVVRPDRGDASAVIDPASACR